MNKSKITFPIAALLFICLLGLTNAFAQTENPRPQPPVEPSYDVVLHTLTASNKLNDKTSIPASLSNIVRKLKTIYSYSNYRLDSTYVERVANTGNVNFKTVSYPEGQNQDNFTPIFSEWSLTGLRNSSEGQKTNLIQFQNFSFGQRIPIKTAAGSVNYEQIGINTKFSLTENMPTVVGSLSTFKPDELIFLILTVKAAQD